MDTQAGDVQTTSRWEKRVAFQVGVQATRAAAYGLASVCGLAAIATGVLTGGVGEALILGSTGLLSALVFYLLIRIGGLKLLGRAIDPLWALTDLVLITWVTAATGGAASPWFIWYLANISGAAFVMGQRAAFVYFVGDTVAYLWVLWRLGDITALDISFYEPLSRMLFLYAASFIFLRGVALLQQKRELIKRMRDSETRRVEELTRLTSALDQRTREIAEANLKIREADRLKSQFLANMSHELRTPLNSIIGFSDVLLSRLPPEFPDKHIRFLKTINTSGQHLLGIINDLLDLSKIEAGKMELNPEPIPVQTTVEGVSAIMRGTAKERDIHFDIDIPADLPMLEADPVKFKQILFNLVSNAAKFSTDGSTVEVSARHLTAADSSLGCDAIEVAVTDHGVGIDPKDHRIIFEEFRQVDGTSTRSFGGTGLGLALVKRLVELHRGTIKVDSAPGEGSTFTVTLPRQFQGNEPVEAPRADTLELPAEGGKRILVVEDDPTAFETISHHLSESGYIPIRARNGIEAMRLAKVLHPSAITLDIILPGADGWEILRQLRQDPVTAEIPVIIVSVLDNRELALTLGAQDYLTKPIDGEVLIRRLVELVPQALTNPRLLLIDDEPELHELVEAKLTPLGYTVDHALSGADGLTGAKEHRPDLIILDLMMEEMDGFEVAARLKADHDTVNVPVVVLTAKEISRRDQERLHGKIEALVGKTEMPHGRLVAVIETVLARQHKESSRA
jgi:signal transduction histidine kinase/DNA-binding response OmpR family regulator